MDTNMRLIECYIENFGKLSDFQYSFSEGLNTIKKDNGYGKTTLTVFIKAMLYGLDDTRRAKLETNDRKHYLPWNGGRCGGSLTFETEGKKYRIERTFMPKAADDTFTLYDLKGGRHSADFSSKVGEELFGIDADGFERTVFLSEQNLSGKNENKSVSAKLSDLVGCDGDLGVMDEAVELLEKQRKIYHKRGGAGEIGELKKKIGELERRIYDLERMEADCALAEKRLAEKKRELDSLYKKRRECEAKNRLADAERLKRNYEKQYLEMKNAVEEEEKLFNELSRFFKNGIPTQREIEEAKEMASAARIAVNDAADESDDGLTELRAFFVRGVSEEEIKMASEASRLEAEAQREAERMTKEAEQLKERIKELPTASVSDIDSLTKEVVSSKKVNKSWQFLIPLGFLTAVLLIGIVLLIIGFKSYRAYKESLSFERARERAEELLDINLSEIVTRDALIDRLYTEKSRAAKSAELKDELCRLEEKATELTERADSILREIYDFISKFPLTDASTPGEAIALIARKYTVYRALLDSRASADKRREAQILEANKKAAYAAEFIARFPTVTPRPYDEVSAKLLEYTSALRSIERMKTSLLQFASEHQIDTSKAAKPQAATLAETVDTEELSAKILAAEREATLAERQVKTLSDELDIKDELYAEKEELELRASEYETRLGVILKTQKYLTEAKDSLTSRYLSPTKAAFDKYVSLIGLESGEDFTMDTSFTVMKNERGTLRQTEAYSRGTRELYALSARLALVDSLYERESPFVILDDPFAYFDDAKLARALAVIKAAAKERQIIYLTCTESRKI